jgi:glycosyltransferase involved in cell wall biosynthesis
MSNTILEALASGLPVLASRIPENRELIEPGRNGLLFDPSEGVPNIARAIVRLYESPDVWMEMSRQARERITAKYSWNQVAEIYENCFE